MTVLQDTFVETIVSKVFMIKPESVKLEAFLTSGMWNYDFYIFRYTIQTFLVLKCVH